MRFTLEKATDGKHKYVGVFTRDDGSVKHVPFGAKGMSDFTLNKDKLRQANYLARHRTTENWNNPETAGALSRWILWNTQSVHQAVSLFRRKFNLK